MFIYGKNVLTKVAEKIETHFMHTYAHLPDL